MVLHTFTVLCMFTLAKLNNRFAGNTAGEFFFSMFKFITKNRAHFPQKKKTVLKMWKMTEDSIWAQLLLLLSALWKRQKDKQRNTKHTQGALDTHSYVHTVPTHLQGAFIWCLCLWLWMLTLLCSVFCYRKVGWKPSEDRETEGGIERGHMQEPEIENKRMNGQEIKKKHCMRLIHLKCSIHFPSRLHTSTCSFPVIQWPWLWPTALLIHCAGFREISWTEGVSCIQACLRKNCYLVTFLLFHIRNDKRALTVEQLFSLSQLFLEFSPWFLMSPRSNVIFIASLCCLFNGWQL